MLSPCHRVPTVLHWRCWCQLAESSISLRSTSAPWQLSEPGALGTLPAKQTLGAAEPAVRGTEPLASPAQVLELEEEGKVNLSVRMKKKALQGALEAAAKKKKVRPTAWGMFFCGSSVSYGCAAGVHMHRGVSMARLYFEDCFVSAAWYRLCVYWGVGRGGGTLAAAGATGAVTVKCAVTVFLPRWRDLCKTLSTNARHRKRPSSSSRRRS